MGKNLSIVADFEGIGRNESNDARGLRKLKRKKEKHSFLETSEGM